MCNTYTDTLTARRLEWIRSLESGAYAQGAGELFTRLPVDLDGEEYLPASYCCIGVGLDVMNPGHFLHGGDSFGGNYPRFRDHYGMSEREAQHLIELNDMRDRSFPFIARFLRKVWGLTSA